MIYVAGTNPAGPVKIGISRDPKRRLSEFNVASPDPVYLFGTGLAYLEVWDPDHTPGLREEIIPDSVVEPLVHSYFADKRIKGEWFDVGAIEVLCLWCTDNSPGCPEEFDMIQWYTDPDDWPGGEKAYDAELARFFGPEDYP